MVKLSVNQINTNISNWFNTLQYKEKKLIYAGNLIFNKSQIQSYNMYGVMKNSSDFYIYVCRNHLNEVYTHIVVDEECYEKNSCTVAYWVAKLCSEYITDKRDISKLKKCSDSKELLQTIVGASYINRVDGGDNEDDSEIETEDNVVPDTVPVEEEEQQFHFMDNTINRPRIIISHTFIMSMQTNIKIINDMHVVFSEAVLNLNIKLEPGTVYTPPVILLPLTILHPMFGSKTLSNGLTYDYRLVRQELSEMKSYNQKEFSYIFSDDIMVRALMGIPGDILVCKRVIFDTSPYEEFVIKRIISKIEDDEENK